KQWTKMSPPVEASPSMSRSRNLAFSAEHNVFIMEVMARGGGPEVWTYRYKKAAPDNRPVPPMEFTVVSERDRARLTWAPSPSPKVGAYHVYRAEGERPWLEELRQVATVKGTSYQDIAVKPGTVYRYVVK